MLSVFKCQFGWTVLRRTGESNPSGCKQPSNASQACPVPTPGVSSEAAPATRWLYQTFRMDLCDIHHQSSNSVPDLGSRQMFGRECRREGTRNRALVFLARIEILSRRQNPHPSKTAKGGAARCLQALPHGTKNAATDGPGYRATPRSTTEPHRGWMSDTYLLHLHAEGEKCFLLTSPFIEPAHLI